jgi:pre-mRNA-splicing factor ATP-dependent RNA helicase DHX16
LKERDEFAQRLLLRDKDKQRSTIIAEEEPPTSSEASIPIDQLREESRRAYLKKRTEKELTLLEQEIQEEEEMFQEDIAAGKLTQQELKSIELKKQILQLARKDAHDHPDSTSQEAFYHLPDEEYEDNDDEDGDGGKKRKHFTKEQQNQALLKSRYKEEKGSLTEQDIWEETQTRKASTHMGTKKHKTFQENREPTHEKEYDLILEDNIDFILQDSQQGYDHRKKGHSRIDKAGDDEKEKEKELNLPEARVETKFLSKREQMAATRKQLPVYPYREEFLAAVKQHQVLILVGETGSGKT